MANFKAGQSNRGFAADDDVELRDIAIDEPSSQGPPAKFSKDDRQRWSSGMEFLMSCIAMSVGLGNVWRFPFTAYENGGGAFLVPYLVVLFLVGKPCYYMETIVGQFGGRSCVKLWSCAPILRGVGWAQMFSMIAVATYYCSLMSLTLRYLLDSFRADLPWAKCLDEWADVCVDSTRSPGNGSNSTSRKSPAELYFTRAVLREKANIDEGIGAPDWHLTLCLLAAWLCILAVLARGLSSSGKASYFLALFPYVVMIGLLVRAMSLDGAINGILFFVRPDWSKLAYAEVWYAAVTQCFFSLCICFGGLVTYASYNDFRHNIYRDVLVVTSLDTLTSLMAGLTIFGILGNLAHELGTDDIANVVRGGSGLAFISYPDAIAKFTWMPQLFAVLFFLMLYILGIGSGIALAGGIISIINDQFPSLKHCHIAIATTLIGFAVGTVYCTPVMKSNGLTNKGFVHDEIYVDQKPANDEKAPREEKERAQWGNDREFLLSCIAMSIGLGNVWRFPFTAYENGGGAFLIPYIFILTVVGRPFYLLEMILGQFSSKSTIKVWDMVPAFRGIGFAQFLVLVALASYYCSLMALTMFYLAMSFQSELPWSKCWPEWGDICFDSTNRNGSKSSSGNVTMKSSAELYFYKEVLREKADINDGLGLPDWRLTICLAASWLVVLLVVVRGVKSSGKAAYFLAIFPYTVMFGLLVRSVTLEGATNGILYFITPNWQKLWEPKVWYNAVSQCFFSLTVCFGAIAMFSSHNKFNHNVYRDAQIVTTLDIFTSLLAGCTIFGILGNLAHELGTNDISGVVRGGTGLAFISYPDAIAKFSWMPQFFAVIFFVMMFVLGIGSQTALASSVISIVHDYFPKWKLWSIACGVVFLEFCVGLIYVTPGGQFMVTFVDYYATSFIAFVPAIFELVAVFYAYGSKHFLDDVEFMLKRRLCFFWTFCWRFITLAIITVIFVYSIISVKKLTYNGVDYPEIAYVIGWILFSVALLQIPIWMLVAFLKKRKCLFREVFRRMFDPSKHWGPKNLETRKQWLEFKNGRN
ncbi:sodium-dependent nutrient amino acid transporter 1-like isoform X2 [Phymastichus coffea]|uniref:sodium-dependent nutrient amino acid transporter 1-like isoform X2 n=1 Tax=Phymastichus coffea TaxID=108790 RepID=UPI00273B31C6|nr:sodium-dependent nutrient amino acid transporter 1-like isoform X2 [Phymastichus coffea]